MPSQTASRHEVSCCRHGGSYPLSCCQVSSWIGGFSSQVHRPPVCPSYWNSLAAYIASKRNLRAGRFPSHNASRKGGCFNAQSKKGVTKTGCCRHRPSRVGEEREVSRNMFRHTPARTHCLLDFFQQHCNHIHDSDAEHSGCDEAHGSRTMDESGINASGLLTMRLWWSSWESRR